MRATPSRSDLVQLQFYFQTSRIKLFVVWGNLQLEDTAISTLQFNTLAAMAEFERGMIAERVLDAHASHHARGLRSAGRIPFGYKSQEMTKQLIVDTTKAETVKRAFRLAASNLSPGKVATILNQRPCIWPDLSQRKWIPRTVLRLLRNKTYLGQLPDGSASAHEPLIHKDLFNQVQQILDQHRTRIPKPRPSKGDDDPFLLRGLLVCRECGAKMTTTSSQAVNPVRQTGNRRPQPKLYYRCRGEKPCSHVSAQFVESLWLKTIKDPPPYLSAPMCKMLRAMAYYWPLLIHANKRRMLTAYLEKITWCPDTKQLHPFPADDLEL